MVVIFTPDYIKAKKELLAHPTLENWLSFEAQRNALPDLFPNRRFGNQEALQAAGKRANDFSVTARQVIPHLRPDEIQQSVSLMLASASLGVK